MKYTVYAIRGYDEYADGTYDTLAEAREAAMEYWDHLSTYDKKRQRVEIRFNETDDGYDYEEL